GERKALGAADMTGAAAHGAGDYPEWLDPHFANVFGDDRADEGAALASRAPLDLRVNVLNAERDRVGGMLSDLKPKPTRWSPWGLRVHLAADAKSPAIHAEPAFLKGLVEIQDEGSQLAALLSGAKPGEQVLDLCAGAGGKTLALAAVMANKGQVFATDDDKRRLAPIHDRVSRSGARNVQVRTPKSIGSEIDDLKGRMDMVLIDAPCTGTGSWRRNPDAKWRMRPGALEQRVKEQAAILDRTVALLKPNGRIVYITCSVLDEENGAQVRGFMTRGHEFSVVPPAEVVKALGRQADAFGKAARLTDDGILMTPRTTETDGFFVSVLQRAG
ncbi:MAG: RsmB/NOP family class I SAM-dependent RNA methyltransferase, partial [Pseudolabrys sp.]|nr:RsmB/NOP family class I SAM-dependent RNA methyltransferase [Pseudolabrys sp.]